jgi:transposase
MIFIGIDWSDDCHAACLIDTDGKKLSAFEISHNQKGFESLHERITKYAATPDTAAVAIETKHSLLVDYLSELGYTLYFLNPKQTDRFRDRYRMSHSKSDGFDAYVLADSLRTDMHLFNALSPLDEQSLMLRVLTRTRESLSGRKTAIQNELTSAFKRYFPLALHLFGKIDDTESIAFLLEYPTYEQASAVSVKRIASLLKRHGISDKIALRHAEQINAKLKEPQPTSSTGVLTAYPIAACSLLRQLQSIISELSTLEEEIKDIYRNHPNKTLIESLPGFGEVLSPVVAAEIGAEVSRFESVKPLKAFAGSCPVTERSGKFQGIHFRRACNMHLRRALHLASRSAIINCCWARELYTKLRAKGHSYARALRAVGDQLIEILYAVLTRRTPYDEAYHLRMKSLHGKSPAILT